MKFQWIPILTAGVFAISSLGVAAQPQSPEGRPAQGAGASANPGGPMGMQGRPDPARRERMMAQRHTELKTLLKLTPEQESAWASFTEAMKPPAKAGPKSMPDRAELAKLTTPERIDRMRTLRNEHMAAQTAQMDKRDEAIKTFYGVLNAEQKKVFDAEHARMGQGRSGQHGKHQGPRGSGPQ